jgi:glycosyltransferase involved in cell wall biosynthesis
VKTPYTETVVPVKINEYLAVGKPVVSTDIPTVSEFNQRHHILFATENESTSFLNAIETALQMPNDEPTIERRREVAALLDWNVLVEQMSDLVEAAAAGKKT